MRPAGWMRSEKPHGCISRRLKESHEHGSDAFDIKLFTSKQVGLAAEAIGLSSKTCNKLKEELEK